MNPGQTTLTTMAVNLVQDISISSPDSYSGFLTGPYAPTLTSFSLYSSKRSFKSQSETIFCPKPIMASLLTQNQSKICTMAFKSTMIWPLMISLIPSLFLFSSHLASSPQPSWYVWTTSMLLWPDLCTCCPLSLTPFLTYLFLVTPSPHQLCPQWSDSKSGYAWTLLPIISVFTPVRFSSCHELLPDILHIYFSRP